MHEVMQTSSGRQGHLSSTFTSHDQHASASTSQPGSRQTAHQTGWPLRMLHYSCSQPGSRTPQQHSNLLQGN